MKQDRKPPRGTPKLREKAEALLQSKTPGVHDLSHDEISRLVHELQVHQIELEMQNDELRRGQIALEEASRKYSDFYDFAPVGFLTLDESGLIREVNLTAASQLGVTRRHLVNKPFRFFIGVEERNRFRLYLKRVFQETGPQPGEIKLHRPDGGSFFAHLDSVAVTDISGARVCRTSITDISDLKLAEEKLQASERLFASFVGHLPSVAVIRDLEGRYLFANAAWEQAFQKRREEWLGKTSEELWPPEVSAKFREQDRIVIESKEALQTLGSLRHPDGLHQWISHRFPIADQDGQPVMIGINAIDVTEPMAVKARLEQVLDSGPAAIYTCDIGRDFTLSYLSENIKMLVGWEARDFLTDSRFWLQHVHPEDRPWVCQRLELPWPQDRQTYEYRFLAKDGAYRWMHDDVRLVRDADGKPVEMAGVWMDITDSKRMEEALRVSLRFLEIVHNFTDIDSLLTAFVSEIKNYTGCEAVGIRGLDAAGVMPYQTSHGFTPHCSESESPLSIHTDHCMCTNVVKGACDPKLPFYTAGGSFWMNHTTRFLATASEQDHWRIRKVCNLEGYESVAMIPIRWGDQILGLIHIADPQENMVPLELVQMLEKAAMQLGTAFERVRAEQALRESEAKYRLLVNQIPAVVFKGYQDWSVDFFDRKIEKLTGYPKAEFDSRQLKWRDLVLPEDLDMALGAFKQALETDKSYVREYRIRKKDDAIAWIQARGQIFCDAAGQVDYVSGVFYDITARKQAEEALRETRNYLENLIDYANAPIIVWDAESRITRFNHAFENLTGYTAHEVIGQKLNLLFPEASREESLRQIASTSSGERWESVEIPILRKDGDIRIALWNSANIHAKDGATLVATIAQGQDITARKEAETIIEKERQRFFSLLEMLPASVCLVAPDLSLPFANRQFREIFGDPRNHTCHELMHGRPTPCDDCNAREILATQKPVEWERTSPQGRTYQVHSYPFNDIDGSPMVLKLGMDITARKETETIIRQERQRFFSLLDMLPAFVALLAPDRTVPFVNRQFREIFGDPEGRLCHELILDRSEPCEGCLALPVFETRQPVDYEWTSPQGKTYQIYDYPFADIDGSPMVLELGMDITARKALEAQLLQAQKMEAVGRLAGGVAHDFNNLLMAIMGYSELIRTSLVREDPLYKYSEDILKATERAASLTQQLLAFSRQQVMQPQVLNLNRVVADLEKMLRRLIGEHIELEIADGPDLGPVKAAPGQINQIIMNLAVNARDAMPKGGRLIMTTDNIEFTVSHKCRFENLPPGRYVRLTVTDTGSGMDGETLDHIFEPFFTTKEVGKGTGLGLPMVYGIVRQNGGCVDVESRPGQGATFTIFLPRIEAAVKAPGARVSLAAKLEGSETILVVEDEDALRTLLCRFFRLYGYNVLEARHGGEALLICERHSGPIHLMITDVVMPQMSGKELADRLAPLHPEMTVFFMSGYTDSDLSGYGAPESSQYFIPKPFRPMDLVKKVRDFLDASGGVKV
jgi:PAS domain S-box-containing protein